MQISVVPLQRFVCLFVTVIMLIYSFSGLDMSQNEKKNVNTSTCRRLYVDTHVLQIFYRESTYEYSIN